MRIGIFTDTYKPQINGVVTSVDLMERILRENGHQPYIFTVSHPDINPLQDDPDHVIRVSSMKFWGHGDYRIGLIYSLLASRKAKELGIEIIHSHAPFSLGIFGHITAKKLNIPEIHTYHTMLADYVHYMKLNKFFPERIAEFYSKIFCNSVDGVIVPTSKVYQKLCAYGVKRPIYILPTGIDLTNFRRNFSEEERLRLRKKYGLTAEDKVLIFVGRIAKEKNIDTLIKYHRSLVEKNPQFKLLIIGAGDYQKNLQNQVRETNLETSVIFAGQRDYNQLPNYYNLADCFVIASTSETQGLVVVEALASGLPVVAIDDNSFSPMVKKGENGYFFKTEQDYCQQITRLVNNVQLSAQFTKKSLEIANHFSAENFYLNLINIYETVLHRHRQLRSKGKFFRR